MKTATFPSVRVEPALRAAAEAALLENESLSGFVERAISAEVERRQSQSAFISRGLAARIEAKESGQYISAVDMMNELQERLAIAKKAKTGRE